MRSTIIKSTAVKIAALAMVAASTMAANAVDLTNPGVTSEANPYDLYANLSPTAEGNIKFNYTGFAYFTNTIADSAETTLCSQLYWTSGAAVMLGDLNVGTLGMTAENGSLLKRGDWAWGGSFLLGHSANKSFAFTNDTGNITTTSIDGKKDAAVRGRLQTGYGNNATAIYCQNGGDTVFQQLFTGFSNNTPGSYAKNSQNYITVNGGTMTIAGRARLGCGVNRTWYNQTGGTAIFEENLNLGATANATNYWTQSGGESSVAGATAIGVAANTVTEFTQTGGTATFTGVFNTGNAAGATTKCEFGGGTTTFRGLTHIGQTANSTNYWRQTGGEVNFSEASFILGFGNGLKVEAFHTNGVLTVDRSLWLSYGDSAANDVYFEVSGGVVTNKANYSNTSFQIGSEGQPGSRAEMKVTGTGKVYIAGPCSVGVKGAGTLTIDGNGLFETYPATRAVVICNGALAAGEDCHINLDGGTLLTAGIDYGSGSSSADGYVTFNGGTLKATASPVEGKFIENYSRLIVRVGENGGTIDTSLASVTIPKAITGVAGTSGGLTFKGGNSATVTGRLSYTGATTVEVGTTLTVADRADIFDTGAGLVCIAPPEFEMRGSFTVLTTSGEDAFTAGDLAKCSFPGCRNARFALADDGKSIVCKFARGLIICVH